MDESTIYKKLFVSFKPSFLKVENESHLHSNHAQSPKSGNSHCAITIKSEVLNNLNRIEGQRKYSINSTPTIIINEKKFEGSTDFKNMKKKIDKLI